MMTIFHLSDDHAHGLSLETLIDTRMLIQVRASPDLFPGIEKWVD